MTARTRPDVCCNAVGLEFGKEVGDTETLSVANSGLCQVMVSLVVSGAFES